MQLQGHSALLAKHNCRGLGDVGKVAESYRLTEFTWLLMQEPSHGPKCLLLGTTMSQHKATIEEALQVPKILGFRSRVNNISTMAVTDISQSVASLGDAHREVGIVSLAFQGQLTH